MINPKRPSLITQKGLNPLERKVNLLTQLAYRDQHRGSTGSETVIDLLKRRQTLFARASEPKERERIARHVFGTGIPVDYDVRAVNEWLENIGKPRLRLTRDDALRMIYE